MSAANISAANFVNLLTGVIEDGAAGLGQGHPLAVKCQHLSERHTGIIQSFDNRLQAFELGFKGFKGRYLGVGCFAVGVSHDFG